MQFHSLLCATWMECYSQLTLFNLNGVLQSTELSINMTGSQILGKLPIYLPTRYMGSFPKAKMLENSSVLCVQSWSSSNWMDYKQYMKVAHYWLKDTISFQLDHHHLLFAATPSPSPSVTRYLQEANSLAHTWTQLFPQKDQHKDELNFPTQR